MAKVEIKYVTPLRTERVDSNHKKLLEDFIVVEIRDGIPRTWTVPAGTISDGKSVPEFLEPIMGDPFEGVTEPSAWIHDYYCVTKERSQKDTHRVFRDMVLHAMRRNTEYGWFRYPWNFKGWQFSRNKLMWAGIRAYNRLRNPEWK